MPEQDLTIDDVALRLKINRKTVERLISSGRLEAYKVGRIHRVTPRALERYKENYQVRPSGPLEKPASEDDLLKIGA